MNRVLGVVRVQLLNVRFGTAVPLAVFGAVLAFNLVAFAANGWGADQEGVGSAMLTLYLTVGAGYIQVTTQTFRFALGMGVTRRAFAAAVAVLAVVEALGYGALLGLLRLVERATDGWGMRVGFFRLDQLGDNTDPVVHWLVYAAPVVALAVVGALVGAVFSRWGTLGVYSLVIGVVLVAGGTAALVTLADGWPAVTGWIAAQPPLALGTGYPLALAVPLAAAGWLVLRRATT